MKPRILHMVMRSSVSGPVLPLLPERLVQQKVEKGPLEEELMKKRYMKFAAAGGISSLDEKSAYRPSRVYRAAYRQLERMFAMKTV